MKQVRQRTLIVFCIAAFLALGLVWFCGRCALQGGDWVGYFGSSYYSTGAIYDRNGVLLYDGRTGTYADSASVRKSTMHLVGDRNIATSMRSVQADRLSGYNPVTGTALGSHDIYLTIDASLNETAYAALNGKKGVVAVYNYKTGEILCLVSAPTYDPLDPPSESSLESSSYEGVYLNRFFSSTFVPGSIFKIVTTAAALDHLQNPSEWRYTCTGSMAFGNQAVTCPQVHGADMTLEQAFARSCNCAYAQLALDMGGDMLYRYTSRAGLLSSIEISGISTATGAFSVENPGSIELAWSASGQHHDMVNPATFLTLLGGIANEGTAVVPSLFRTETFASTKIPSSLGESKSTYKVWSKSTCQTLTAMMRNNVLETYGQSSFGDLAVCAKSGTAEVGGGNQPHSWFAGFLDDGDNPLAFLVLVENGGYGSTVAGSIASKVLLQATSEN